MQPTTDDTSWVQQVSDRLDNLPKNPKSCVKEVHEIFSVFRTELAKKLESPINELIQSCVDADADEKRECATLVNFVLATAGLGIACPKFENEPVARIPVGAPRCLAAKVSRNSSYFVLHSKSSLQHRAGLDSKVVDGTTELRLIENLTLPSGLNRERLAIGIGA